MKFSTTGGTLFRKVRMRPLSGHITGNTHQALQKHASKFTI